MKTLFIFVLLILLFSQNVLVVKSLGEFDKTVFVESVVDGDTFRTNEGEYIRLADIDTPEENKTGYEEAKDFMIYTIERKFVFLDIDDIYTFDDEGKGNRYVCVVYVEQNQTHYLNVNQALIRSNLAIEWDHFNEFDPFTWTTYIHKNDIPEFSSWMILSFIVSITLFAAIIKRKLKI